MLACKGIFATPSMWSPARSDGKRVSVWVLRNKTTTTLYFKPAPLCRQKGEFFGKLYLFSPSGLWQTAPRQPPTARAVKVKP